MLIYCLKWKKYRKYRFKTIKNYVMIKCAVFGSKKSRFVKEQELKEILSNLGLNTNKAG